MNSKQCKSEMMDVSKMDDSTISTIDSETTTTLASSPSPLLHYDNNNSNQRIHKDERIILRIVLGIIVSAVYASLVIMRSVFLGKLLGAISGDSEQQFHRAVVLLILIASACIIVRVVSSNLEVFCAVSAENVIVKRWIPELLRKRYSFFLKLGQARVQNMVNELTLEIVTFIRNTFFKLCENVIKIIACSLACVALSWKIGLVIIGFLTLIIFSSVYVQRIYQRYEKVQTKLGLEAGIRRSALFTRFIVIKAFGTEEFEANKARRTDKLPRSYLVALSAYSCVGAQLIVGFLYPLVIGYGGYIVFKNEMSFQDLTVIYFLTIQLSLSAQNISDQSNNVMRLVLTYKNFTKLFGDATDNEQYSSSSSSSPLYTKPQEITFQNVSFQEDTKQILHDLFFTIPTGSKVALIGPSGAGKSSLLNLLMHLTAPTSGAILLGDDDINTIPVNLYRQNIAYVPQDSLLIVGTVRENICYGRDCTDQEIYDAAKTAAAHEFIMNLPDKYDTVVGEGGLQLSGGQRQRICIARAFCRKAKLLILDEVVYAFLPP
ncbi:hypothetical protein HK102_009368 [Quaeritorhiza haematococci]|nr:hypothetical protein HK102_009368 [Quaeritorhiza haematococci]